MKCYLNKTCEFLDFQEYFTISKQCIFFLYPWPQGLILAADTHKHMWGDSRNYNQFTKNPVAVVQNPKELYKYIKDLYKNKSTHYMNPWTHIYQKEQGPEFMSQMKELKARKNLN